MGEAEGPGLIWVWDGGDKDERWWEDEVTPLRSPYRPSTSDPITASLSFPHPSASILSASVSSFLASFLFKLAHWSSLNPYKEGGKERITIKDLNDCEGIGSKLINKKRGEGERMREYD